MRALGKYLTFVATAALITTASGARAQEGGADYWTRVPSEPAARAPAPAPVVELAQATPRSGGRRPPGAQPGRSLRPGQDLDRGARGGIGDPIGADTGDESLPGDDIELTTDDLTLDDDDDDAATGADGDDDDGADATGAAAQAGGGQAGGGQVGGGQVGGGQAGGGQVGGGQAGGGQAGGAIVDEGGQPRNQGAGVGGGRQEILPTSPDLRGNRVDILDGDIPVIEFLRFLAGYTQLPVLPDATAQTGQGLQQPITIAAPILNVDDEMVKAILEANRWLVSQKVLASGTRYLEVTFLGGAAAPGSEAPSATPLITVKTDGTTSRVDQSEVDVIPGLLPDQIITMLFELEYREPADAIEALNTLITQSASAGQARTAAARNRAFSIVEIRGTNMVIVTAKYNMLDYLRTLLEIIDVEYDIPERIVHIVEVEEADASELVGIIENFLQQSGTTSRRGIGGRRTTPTARPGQPAAPTAVPGARDDEYQTTLIPDPRTQKIIVQTYSQSDLEDISMLVKELDTRFDIRRLRTRIYRMNFLKAIEVAPVIQQVLGLGGGVGSRTPGLGTTRTRQTTRTQGAGAATPGVSSPVTGVGAQGGVIGSLIVPHEETNSLIIQAEPEDYQEILNILNKIDTKRRQVFLEAALVQVSTSSALNYTIELLAGEPDDRDTRLLFESSFGLSGIDTENFTRIFPDLTTAPSGAIAAFMTRGKFPALISALKANSDSEVLATPFILADDNVENEINITETRFVLNTNTVNQATTTTQQGEDAGITLNIVPTISSSNAVLLDVQLEVSEFAQTQTVDVLPPKTTNRITSAVTISDDRIYVVGGLTRQSRSKTVSKVPLLGDIPLLGKLFRSESTAKSVTNLYIFLRAHILTDENFRDLSRLSEEAVKQLQIRHPGIKLQSFENFEATDDPPPSVDPDAARTVPNVTPDGRRRSGYPRELDSEGYNGYDDYSDDPGRPGGGIGLPESDDPRGSGRSESLPSIGTQAPIGTRVPDDERSPRAIGDGPGEVPRSDGSEAPPPSAGDGSFWNERELELDESGDSWILPLKPKETARSTRRGSAARRAG